MISLVLELSNKKNPEPSDAAKMGVATGLAGLSAGTIAMAKSKAQSTENRNEILRLRSLLRRQGGVINPPTGAIDQNPQIDI